MRQKKWMQTGKQAICALLICVCVGILPGCGEGSRQESFVDGSYTGVARGYRQGVHVVVSIRDGRIADVSMGQHNEDQEYLEMCLPILTQLKEEGSTRQVDTVSGATKTCDGILAAFEDALAQARSE